MKQKKGVFMKSELLAEANKNYPNSEYHYNENDYTLIVMVIN